MDVLEQFYSHYPTVVFLNVSWAKDFSHKLNKDVRLFIILSNKELKVTRFGFYLYSFK